MNPARELEQLAIRVVRGHIGDRGTVVDTSAGHDPDFRIDYIDGRVALGEVGWHADEDFQAMWDAIHKRGEVPQVIPLDVGGGLWSVGLTLSARIARLYAELPVLVRDLLASGQDSLDIHGDWPSTSLADRARTLGIAHMSRVEGDGDNAVFFPPGVGGVVPTDPNVITAWIDDVLVRDPSYQDATQKLLSREADERQVFLMAGTATPFGVEERLRRLDDALPSTPPQVPAGITHVWAISSFQAPSCALWELDRGWSAVSLLIDPT